MSRSQDRRMHSSSRTTENFTLSGLTSLTGQGHSKWGRYIAKELLDNALEAGESPEIRVRIGTDELDAVGSIHVSDDGPGISDSTIHQIFGDVDTFGGTKRHYCLPTRGNQGNALMTVLGIQHLCEAPLTVKSNGRVYQIVADTETYTDGVEVDIEEIDLYHIDLPRLRPYRSNDPPCRRTSIQHSRTDRP